MVLLALHVIVAFAAVGFLVVPGAILVAASKSQDVPFIRRVFALGAFHGKIGGPLAILAGILGFAVAGITHTPLGSGWLIASYVAYVLVVIVGIGYHARWEIRVFQAAQASPDGEPSPELVALVADPIGAPMMWLSAFLWIAIIYLMVARPF